MLYSGEARSPKGVSAGRMYDLQWHVNVAMSDVAGHTLSGLLSDTIREVLSLA